MIATALEHHIPIIVSNDSHIASKVPKYGLIIENPVPKDVREKWLSGKQKTVIRREQTTTFRSPAALLKSSHVQVICLIYSGGTCSQR